MLHCSRCPEPALDPQWVSYFFNSWLDLLVDLTALRWEQHMSMRLLAKNQEQPPALRKMTPLLFLLLPLHLYENPGITAVGKALPDQSPACDRSTPCHQTTAHLDIISAIVLEAIPKTNLGLLKPPSLQDHTP